MWIGLHEPTSDELESSVVSPARTHDSVRVYTLNAGVYGMSFDDIPEVHWALGYPFALALMVGCSGALWVFFKRSGWL